MGLSLCAAPALAAPVAHVFDDDLAFRDAGFHSLGSVLLPISAGLTGAYHLTFDYEPATAGSGHSGGANVLFGDGSVRFLDTPVTGHALGLRLIVATTGEATNTVQQIPAATTLTGPVDPLAIGLLLPAVQSVRDAGPGPNTCEPPPEPVCEPPPSSSAPFEPVDWLVFNFGEPLLSIELLGAYDFRPASGSFGPNDIALEVHYLRLADVEEPAPLTLLGVGLVAAAMLRRPRR
jgi:prepilin-type processing-associated H-X9-DG protein